ncbi:MAG: carboxypeptidase-like regulatory domain-containing protein, partial [Mucilaginibacter sp.]|nr:carboxypeptidase-like regulatory domain-containing protein [Mucilaginibacter sp.]
ILNQVADLYEANFAELFALLNREAGKSLLDAVGETKIVLPDSIFPQADLIYTVHARFLNSDNQVRDDAAYGTFKSKATYIKTDALNDKLKIELRKGSDLIKQMAIVNALTAGNDTLSKIKVLLPADVNIDQNAASYNIETGDLDEDVEIKDFKDELSVSGQRTPDSVIVMVNNPRKLKYFYTLFDGPKRIGSGQATNNLNYRLAYPGNHLLTFNLDYLWAGEMHHQENSLVYEKNKLNIMVKQPVSVYPGQRVETAILVTDMSGKPVPGADVTAWSITRKFEDYNMPNVPDFGRYFSAPKRNAPYIVLSDDDKDGSFKLDWLKQGKRLGLDSIEYFKFTHPVKTYGTAETGKDTITQIAPFVVQQGEILPVHIVYIDQEPVYFRKAQQLQPYSFKVEPGMHKVRLRTSSMDISVDSIMVPRGRKFIISFNADAFQYQKKNDTLDRDEARLIDSRMLTVTNNFNERKTLVKQQDRTFFLNPNGFAPPQVLVGPLEKDYSVFESNGTAHAAFSAEPDYSYLFEQGWVKQKSLPNAVAFNKSLTTGGARNYTQYVFTNKDIDSLWDNYLDDRANRQMLIKNDEVTGLTGRLIIQRQTGPNAHAPLIKNIILFKKDDVEFIRVYPGNTTNFGSLNPGRYKAFYLLKHDDYEIKDDIEVKANGENYYKTDISPVHCKDAVSTAMTATIAGLIPPETYQTSEANENARNKLSEAFNSRYLDRAGFTHKMTGVVMDANDKTPLPGATVKVKGTDVGTNTGIDGSFEITVPSKGKLSVLYIGYHPKEVKIAPGTHTNIELISAANSLNEVVVVGYGTVLKKSLTGAVSTVSIQSALAGKVAGIQILADTIAAEGAPGAGTVAQIRGISGYMSGKEPLYVVDGVVIPSIRGIPVTDIENISVLKNASATTLYGSRAVNGVIVITTKQTTKIADAEAVRGTQDQKATLRRNFRDYAYWQPKLTTDEQGKAVFTATFPDDITNWRTFVAAANDNKQTGVAENSIKAFKPLSANFFAPQFAIVGDEMKLIGKVMNYNASPVQVTRSFTYNGKLNKQDQFSVSDAKIDTFSIVAADKDSLSFEYSVKQDNYIDGEQRTVPVYKAGVTETKGQFASLQGDTSLTMSFDRSLGKVTFRAEASVLPVLLQEAEHLRNYKYLCNEQLASKLKGLIAEKRIAKALSQDFKYNKNVKDIIKKLTDNRKTAGTWGWWKDSEEELWISLHATEALLEAEEAGFTIPLDKQKLIDYLIYQIGEYYGADKLQCLQLLSKLKAKVDYPKLINTVTADMAKSKWITAYDRLQLLSLKQQQGIKINADSLQAKARRTMFGNLYWGDESYRLFDNSIQETLLAYQIMKTAGKSQDMLAKIRGYLLEQRKTGQWRNTYESARVLETLLPDVLDENGKTSAAKLVLKGATDKVIDKFPYVDSLSADKIALTKTGKMPVYVTGYQQFWNSKPQRVDKDFTVDTWFEEKGKKVAALKAGETVYLQAKVQVKAEADHVMVEIPIPAGCSYEEKDQQWANNEVHREHFKEKVSIFCSKLKQGTYTFKVKLMPRYGGKYTLNPAKAELMYFPVFYGREAIGKVEIK